MITDAHRRPNLASQCLGRALRELLSRTHLQTTVAEVAMRWSFWHLGRFSSSYRALFKELPSETLKR